MFMIVVMTVRMGMAVAHVHAETGSAASGTCASVWMLWVLCSNGHSMMMYGSTDFTGMELIARCHGWAAAEEQCGCWEQEV